jgi:hypothetical protein
MKPNLPAIEAFVLEKHKVVGHDAALRWIAAPAVITNIDNEPLRLAFIAEVEHKTSYGFEVEVASHQVSIELAKARGWI